MDEEETKVCPNCKRDIPSVNFTIHTVHCARNIKVCPVCKEPVPQAELQEHHEKLHKELPCKQCGENVCGTDLEDHIRDSCARTIKSCRFCELELPRHDIPAHEGYCGVRTEQCPDCREWVMIKYRQIHLDSNHGFLRLNDDPAPVPVIKKEFPKLSNIDKPLSNIRNIDPPANAQYDKIKNILAQKKVANTETSSIASTVPVAFTSYSNIVKNTNISRAVDKNQASGSVSNEAGPSRRIQSDSNRVDSASTDIVSRFADVSRSADISQFNDVSRSGDVVSRFANVSRSADVVSRSDDPRFAGYSNGALSKAHDKQVNIQMRVPARNERALSSSQGAVKKRRAPQPPPCERRDLPYYSAEQRRQAEERRRREINERNMALGLPPVLTPAEKVEKLRKMDALHNREVEVDYRDRLQSRVWGAGPRGPPGPPGPPGPSAGHVLGADLAHRAHDVRTRYLNNLKPMTHEEFMKKFETMQLKCDQRRQNGGGEGGTREVGNDRFSEIKSSLRELRRGLNEVTAPYNTNNNERGSGSGSGSSSSSGSRSGSGSGSRRRQRAAPAAGAAAAAPPGDNDDTRLPCEFCGALVPAHDLVQHQTGCRPDLARLVPKAPAAARAAPPPAPPPMPDPYEEPVIPCEFCTESLPVYLITEHQERCRSDANLLFPD